MVPFGYRGITEKKMESRVYIGVTAGVQLTVVHVAMPTRSESKRERERERPKHSTFVAEEGVHSPRADIERTYTLDSRV